MCDSLLFINNGRIVHHGDAESLKRSTDTLGGVLYDVQLDGDPQALSDWAVLQPNIEFLESRKTGGRIRIDTEDPNKAADVLSRMVKDNLRVIDFHREQRNLEDAFIDILANLEKDANFVSSPPPLPPQKEPTHPEVPATIPDPAPETLP
jgi:ABC-2 type transport system ATP-binding protein